MISAPTTTEQTTTTTGLKRNKHLQKNRLQSRTRTKSRGVTALMYACQQGDVSGVDKIIRTQPSSLWIRDRTGKTPLHYSCTSDNRCAAQTADLLVMAAPDLIDSRDEDGFTPLHLAVIAGNMPLVTFLLANNADVNAVDNEKHTVVHWATVCGETAALRAVLAAGAPVSTPDVHGGYPLHYAAQMCGGEKDSNLGLQVLQTLLTHSDVVVSVTDGDGRQPLLWAASAGSAKAALALIRAGAAVEASDKDGLTALHCAASRGHTDCIDTLLTLCGASTDIIDSNGCTALHYAVTLGHADATALLLAHGADPDRQDRKGRSPAHCGCAKGQFETVRMLGAHGANLWLRNARGDLPLHEAAASGRRELVKWLLEMRPSQVNARNNDGRCPLHLAALNDNPDMCKILLDAGAQINPVLRTSKNTFMTPLDCALQRGFRSTAKYLQLHGGVPANRLKDTRYNRQENNLNLQIKNDITFWGDTSSDSERENGEIEQNTKKVQRKKLSHKYEKKRASLSGSDLEIHRKFTNRLESGRKLMEKSHKGKLSTDKSDSMSSSLDNQKLRNRDRFDYTNEIIINGKTEINIHQTKQITISKELPDVETVKEVSAEKIITAEKEKRPKSAKYTKTRDKSGKSNKNSSVKANIVRSSAEKSGSERKLNSNGKESNLKQVKDEVNELKKINSAETTALKDEQITNQKEELKKLTEKKSIEDHQSIISNTSEELEEHKRVTVEAAIHEPPKDLKVKQLEEVEKIEENIQQKVDKEEYVQESVTDENHVKVNLDNTIRGHDNQVLEESGEITETTHETKDSLLGKGALQIEEEGKKTVDSSSQTIADELEEKAQIVKDEVVLIEEKIQATMADRTGEKAEEENQEEKAKVDAVEDLGAEEQKQEEKVKVNTVEDLEATQEQKEDIAAESCKKLEEITEGKREESIITQKEKGETGAIEEQVLESTKISKNQNNQVKEKLVKVDEEKSTDHVNGDVHKKDQEIVDEEKNENTKTSRQNDGQQNETVGDAQKEFLGEEKEGQVVSDKEVDKPEENNSRRKKRASDSKTTGLQNLPKNEDGPTESNMNEQREKDKTKKRNSHRKKWDKKKAYEIIDSTIGHQQEQSDEENSSDKCTSSSTTSSSLREHKSFRVLDANERKVDATERSSRRKTDPKKQRSRSEEGEHRAKTRKSRIPTPVIKSTTTTTSRSDKFLDIPGRKVKSNLESRVPSLPNIHENRERIKEQPRCESNMSAPLLASVYSDNERGTGSDEEEDEKNRSTVARKRLVKRRSKTRDTHSAGSDYESSHVIDSGFEPSPRSSRIPKWRNMSERGVNMASITQTIQSNIRRYHLERKIFQHLLELKRLQIRAGQHNEAILVKRAIDAYHQSCASTVGAGRYIPEDYTFKSFEKFLYLALRKLQRNGADYLKNLPESPANPLLCTRSTNRCMHATHAYTGIPCAAYLPMMDHHSIPKIGFTSTDCKPGTGFLPNINNRKKAVTLELCHGTDKQIISLPTDRLDQNKRYYVTFTVKGNEEKIEDDQVTGHTHAKSD